MKMFSTVQFKGNLHPSSLHSRAKSHAMRILNPVVCIFPLQYFGSVFQHGRVL